MANFTFKKFPKSGRFQVFELNDTEIKLNKMQVGSIAESRLNHKYHISFAVKREPTEKDPANFKWTRLTKTFDTEPEARDFVKKHEKEIQEKYNLHSFKS